MKGILGYFILCEAIVMLHTGLQVDFDWKDRIYVFACMTVFLAGVFMAAYLMLG